MGDAIVADVGATLAQLADGVSVSSRQPLPPLPDFPAPARAEGYLHPEELFALLRQHAPDDAVYVNESTSTPDAFWSQLDLRTQGSYYFPASGGLGFGLPAAVGAQLALPGRQVIAVIGDGSANYGITALWTAARLGIPVVVIILKNGTYGALRWFTKVIGTGETPGLDVPGIDFVRIAEGYGVPARAVSSAADFVLCLKDALTATGPALIEVTTADLRDAGLTAPTLVTLSPPAHGRVSTRPQGGHALMEPDQQLALSATAAVAAIAAGDLTATVYTLPSWTAPSSSPTGAQ